MTHTKTRKAFNLIAVLFLTLAASIIPTSWLTAEPAQAASNILMDDTMIDSFTVAVKRAEGGTGEYEPCPDDGACQASVYDTLRLTMGFHIPAGTLSISKNTVDAYLELDGNKDGWGNIEPKLYGEQKGNIIINGEEAGAYSVRVLNPLYENYSSDREINHSYSTPVVDDKYRYRVRIRFQFNADMVERNQHMVIDGGTLYFDLDGYWLGPGGTTPIIGFGEHVQQMSVQGIHITLDKETVGEPSYNPNTGLVEQKWKIVVDNDGNTDLPANWYLSDTMFANDAPTSITDTRGYVPSAGFACRLDGSTYCDKPNTPIAGGVDWNRYNYQNYYWMSNSGLYSTVLYRASGISNSISYSANSEYWRMAALKAGDTITYEYTSYSPWQEGVSHVTNRVPLYPNTKYYPEILSDTAQYAMPEEAEGSPYLTTTKKHVSTNPVDDCLEGAEGCLLQTTWKTTVKNTGTAAQSPVWQIVDQLNRTSITTSKCTVSSKYSWYRTEDVQDMLDSLAEQGVKAQLDSLELCGTAGQINDGWRTIDDDTDLTDAYDARQVVGVKISIRMPLEAGASVVLDYTSTSDSHGWSGQHTFTNAAQACRYNGTEWHCYPGGYTLNNRTVQQVSKGCSGGYGDGSSFSITGGYWLGQATESSSMKGELGSCGISATIAPTDQGKQVTFHDTVSVYEPRSNGIPTGFTLVGNKNRTCKPSSSNPTCWGITAPTEVGDKVEQVVNNGATTVTIIKTSDTEWDITFHTPESSSNYYSNIRFWIVYQQQDFLQSAWKTVNNNGREEYSIGGVNAVHATVTDGIMNLTDTARWYHYHYDNGSTTAAKTEVSHTPYGKAGTTVAYTMGFNPNTEDLNPDGNTVSMTDTLSSLTAADSAVLDESSITVKYLDSPQSQSVQHSYSWFYSSNTMDGSNLLSGWKNGYAYCHYSSIISSTAPSDALTLDPSQYTVNWDSATHTLTIDGLPDASRIWVEYSLIFNSTNAEVTATNSATLTVDGQPARGIQTASTTSTFPIYKSAAVANITGVFVQKTEEGNPGVKVPDAKYELLAWDGADWAHERDLTTTDGAVTVDKLACGQAYRLIEREAPNGYELSEDTYDFTLRGCSTSVENRIPADWDGADHLIMDTLTVTDKKLPSIHSMPITGTIPWLYLLMGAGIASMLGASVLIMRSDGKKNKHEMEQVLK